MSHYAMCLAVACILGASRLYHEYRPENPEAQCDCSTVTLELPVSGASSEYTCNNATFDWMVQTLITQIAQLVDSNQEKDKKIRQLQQTSEKQRQIYEKYMKEAQERYETQLDELRTTQAQGDIRPKDCSDIQLLGNRYSGLYHIELCDPLSKHHSFKHVFCDLDTAGGGWLVIQRRINNEQPFNRSWQEYKQGFGDLVNNFWLGNEHIHAVTRQRQYQLRVDMLHQNGSSFYANYETFQLSSEKNNYGLLVDGFSGNAGDSLRYHNGLEFSTRESDHDLSRTGNCAQMFGGGGWWFGECYDANLNGQYTDEDGQLGIIWSHLNFDHVPLKMVEMKVRPTYFKPD